MKIHIIKNNVTDTQTLDQGIALVKQWMATIGQDLEFDIADSTKQFSTVSFTNTAVGVTAQVFPTEILAEAPSGYDIVCLVYDWTKVIGPQPKNPSDSLQITNGENPMQLPIQWYATYPEVFASFFLHELCHYESFKNKVTVDLTHLLNDGTLQAQYPVLYKVFSVKQPKDYYLHLLNGIINATLEASLPPDDPSHLFNTATGQLNPLYKPPQWPINVVTPQTVSETIPQIITRVCLENGVEPELGIAVATAESGLNPRATLYNPPSESTDRGLFQWNSKYHSEITDQSAFDPAIATKYFCDAVKAGKLHAYWSASEPNWKKHLSPELLAKYGIK